MNNKYIDNNILDTTKLHPSINIDVMSVTCNIGTKFILENIHEYIDLTADCIISSQFKNKLRYIQLIDGKKYKKAFSNQITLIVKISQIKYLNVKLFVNGSLQITGGEKIDDYNILFDKLFSKLRMDKAIIVDDNVVNKPFLEDITKLCINGFKINMINSGCKINFMINRDNLYSILLTKEKLSVTYEPMTHAGVSIPYLVNNMKKASIFVFESGRLIITGVKTVDDINGAHKYISDLLNKWKSDIMKKEAKNIDDIISMLKMEKGLLKIPVYKGKPRGRKKKVVDTNIILNTVNAIPINIKTV
jgi:TATA-box binding protein (TBP) (component of TFIID and TFIIIB)